jgi:hypothetical protein
MTPTPEQLAQTLGVEPHEAEFYAKYLEVLETVADELLNPRRNETEQ